MGMEREGGGGGGEGWRAEEGGGRIRVTRKTASSQKNQVRRKIYLPCRTRALKK